MDASCLTSSHCLKLGGTVLRSSAHILSVSSADGYDVIFRAMTRKPATTVSSSAFASGGLARATQTKAVSGREGASSSGRKLEMAVASNVIPHPDKVDKGREDADFISLHTDVLDDDEQAAADSKCLTNTAVICVADGVGGWADEGVDPALHSREFVGHIKPALNMAHDQVVENPRLLLHMAHSATTAEGAETAGPENSSDAQPPALLLFCMLLLLMLLADAIVWKIIRRPFAAFFLTLPFLISSAICSCIGIISAPILNTLADNGATGREGVDIDAKACTDHEAIVTVNGSKNSEDHGKPPPSGTGRVNRPLSASGADGSVDAASGPVHKEGDMVVAMEETRNSEGGGLDAKASETNGNRGKILLETPQEVQRTRKILPQGFASLVFVPVGVFVASFATACPRELWGVLVATVLSAAVGLADDFLLFLRKSEAGHGLPSAVRFLLQMSVGVWFACWLDSSSLRSPYSMRRLLLLPPPFGLCYAGEGYLPLTAACFVLLCGRGTLRAMEERVSVAVTGGVAAASLVGMALAVLPVFPSLSVFGVSMAGACMGYLAHARFRPHSSSMGSTGTRAFAGALVAMASCTGLFLPLAIISSQFFGFKVILSIQRAVHMVWHSSSRQRPYKKWSKSPIGLLYYFISCILAATASHFAFISV